LIAGFFSGGYFGIGKNAFGKFIGMPIHRGLDTPRINNISANTKDHAFFR
jgi:hypothetical protein